MGKSQIVQPFQIIKKQNSCYSTLRLYFLLQAWIDTQEKESQPEFRQPFIREWYVE